MCMKTCRSSNFSTKRHVFIFFSLLSSFENTRPWRDDSVCGQRLFDIPTHSCTFICHTRSYRSSFVMCVSVTVGFFSGRKGIFPLCCNLYSEAPFTLLASLPTSDTWCQKHWKVTWKLAVALPLQDYTHCRQLLDVTGILCWWGIRTLSHQVQGFSMFQFHTARCANVLTFTFQLHKIMLTYKIESWSGSIISLLELM